MAKSQSEVNYRPGDEQTSCLNCAFYQEPNSCTQVEGEISAAGLCDLFTPKGADAELGAAPQMSIEDMLFGGGLPNV